jgi:hypothetical protein
MRRSKKYSQLPEWEKGIKNRKIVLAIDHQDLLWVIRICCGSSIFIVDHQDLF